MKRIFVISGPSGSGKSTLIHMLLSDFEAVSTTTSHTTREKRANETEGIDYYFTSKPKFLDMISEGQFIEYVECFGNFYGTSIEAIKKALKNSDICLMDLEWKGAFNLLEGGVKFDDTELIGILILPPSISGLKKRLNKRGSETQESLEKRVKESFEVDKVARYDHIIINDDLFKAYDKLKEIICGN